MIKVGVKIHVILSLKAIIIIKTISISSLLGPSGFTNVLTITSRRFHTIMVLCAFKYLNIGFIGVFSVLAEQVLVALQSSQGSLLRAAVT